MNIVKFKDVIVGDELGLTPDQVQLFNTKFKDQYVHCINWTYCVAFDDMPASVPEVSQNPSLLEDTSFLELSKVSSLVDLTVTEKINSIQKYIEFNNFTPDPDITVDELKKFRTWLAGELLNFMVTDSPDDLVHVLRYYYNGMMDDVIKRLSVFGDTVLALEPATPPGCGCGSIANKAAQSVVASTVKSSSCGCSSGNLSGLYAKGLNQCDPIFIYRKNIYLYMVDEFSKIDFWTRLDPEFLVEMKKYIDNIIRLDFDMVRSTFASDYVDCGCVNDNRAAQERQIARLQKLSQSLEFMINGDVKGHKIYISTALNEWATYLYEIMEW